MRWLIDIPVRRKVALITVMASTVALLLAGSVFVAYEGYAYRAQKLQEIAVQSDILAASVSASLEFSDPKAAQEYLNALRASSDLVAAALYDSRNALFASYLREGMSSTLVPISKGEAGQRFVGDDLQSFSPVMHGTRQVGTVYLLVRTEALWLRLARYGGIILLVMIGSLLITLPVSMRLHAVIVEPISDIASAARRVAAGEIMVPTIRSPRADEIGQLQESFRLMGISLQDKAAMAHQIASGNLAVVVTPHSDQDVLGNAFAAMLSNLQAKVGIAKLIATGDLTVPVALQSPEDELGKAFGTMVDNLRDMNREVSQGVGVLATSTSAILEGMTQVASAAAEAATVISETAVTLDEVKQTALISSQKAKYVSEAAQRATQVSQTGQRAVQETIDGMQQIREQMETIADSTMRLSEQTQAIGEIVASVNDLAEQSNLLAVNASIEAAKAGEHGRGFAVVAFEVKSLAAQSRQATAQVRTILGDIQKATANAVLATEQGSKAVDAGARQSQEAGEAIERLAESIAESASAASQIAVSAQQQVAGMDQLALAMGNIKTATAQNLDSTRQTEAAAHRLDEVGKKLRGMVERYKA